MMPVTHTYMDENKKSLNITFGTFPADKIEHFLKLFSYLVQAIFKPHVLEAGGFFSVFSRTNLVVVREPRSFSRIADLASRLILEKSDCEYELEFGILKFITLPACVNAIQKQIDTFSFHSSLSYNSIQRQYVRTKL